MSEPTKFVLGEDPDEAVRNLELMALAKSWTTLQKMTYFRMAVPVEMEPVISKLPPIEVSEDPTEEDYKKMKSAILTYLKMHMEPTSISSFFALKRNSDETALSYF